jgi:hypothetical protein
MDVTRLRLAAVFLRFLPVPGAKSIGVSSDKQLISVSFMIRGAQIAPHFQKRRYKRLHGASGRLQEER